MPKPRAITCAVFIILIMIMFTGADRVEASSIKLQMNGVLLKPDNPPVTVKSTVLVPLRFLADSMDIAVEYDSASKSVLASRGDTNVKLLIGGKAYRNGKEISLDVPASIINGRTMVPLRFIADAFGASVYWSPRTKTVDIAYKGNDQTAGDPNDLSSSSSDNKYKGQALVTLTFDDARADFARVAVPIMERYNLTATVFVITGWTDGTCQLDWGKKSGAAGPCSVSQLKYCNDLGFEIGSHGDQHVNSQTDLETSIEKLKNWGLTRNGKIESFGSPNNGLNANNVSVNSLWYQAAGLTCARTGKVHEATNLNILNNMYLPVRNKYLLTANIIPSDTTLQDILPVLNDAIQNRQWCIFQLHSVLYPGDPGYGNDIWYWDATKFAQLCDWLSKLPQYKCMVTTLRDGVKYASQPKP